LPETFTKNLNFDRVFDRGLPLDESEINRFNVFDKPFYYIEMKRLVNRYKKGEAEEFFEKSPLDIAPQGDDRPFPGKIIKISGMGEVYKSTGKRFYSLLMSSEVVVGVVFVEALLAAILILILPLFIALGKKDRPTFFSAFYFLFVGAGFMFVEMYFIKAYTFVFGDPVISFAAVLAGILIFSALGGLFSQKVDRRHLRLVFFVLLLILLFFRFYTIPLTKAISGHSQTMAHVLAIVLLIPAGFFMGLPFTLGMRLMLANPVQRAYAWAANGCASILTSVAAAQAAVSFGIDSVLTLAVTFYFLAMAVLVFRQKKEPG
jgi:hypothetical protein